MNPFAIIDAGPLVAFLDKSEAHHDWVTDQIQSLKAPLLVCEAVLTEAFFLLHRLPPARESLLTLVASGALKIKFRLHDELVKIQKLCVKYRDVPMSLADACIVRMTELEVNHLVMTFDSDFSIYRKHGRAPLQLITP